MKKRKSALVAFLLAAVTGIGIGYAAVSDKLFVAGTIAVTTDGASEAFNEDVYFASVDNVTNCTAHIDDADKDRIDSSITGLKGIGDTATITATIHNVGTLPADIKVSAATVGASYVEYFDVTTDWGTETKTLDAGTVDSPSTIQIVITVTMKKATTNAITTSLDVKLDVSSGS